MTHDNELPSPLMITVLAGGVGAARFLRGLVAEIGAENVTAIVNVGDDFALHGLWICPDLDTVRYTLAGEVGPLGWGRLDDSHGVMHELASIGQQAPTDSRANDWFTLGDKDLATHLYRSQRRAEGATLTTITQELCIAVGVHARLLPVTDDLMQTRIELMDGSEIDFQQYFVALRHAPEVRSLRFEGAEHAKPGSEVLSAILDAEQIIIAPSNPFLSIAPLLAVPGVADALRSRRARTSAVSPIVGGAAIKGPAADLLHQLGYESSALSVAKLWSEYASSFVIDTADATLRNDVEELGVQCVVTNTIMTDFGPSRALAHDVIGILSS